MNASAKPADRFLIAFSVRKICLTILLLTFVISFDALAQETKRKISGVVKDATGEKLPGVNIVVKNTSIGVFSDKTGSFSIEVPPQATHLVFSFIGFLTQEVPIPASDDLQVVMEEDAKQLDEIVITVGSRTSQRTITDTPLPIDNLSIKELNSTGQISFDKALQYRVPSFNTVNTPVNDATSLLDPYEIRNMGPSRTLILINGKRKNLSSLVYTQTSPGRGETGADLSAIPTSAIKRVEILRDGASAQYGSDAIAGVMNVILKDRYEATELSVTSGVTTRGDGANYGLNFNSGANFGDKGFINYNISFLHQNRTNRSGKIDLAGEASPVVGFGDGTEATTQNIANFLARYPDAKNINGQPDNTAAKFLINTGIPITDNIELYANAAYVYRKSLSFANYRTPYWKQDFGLLHAAGTEYIGYHPTFEGDLNDYNGTLGVKGKTESGWSHDVSLTVGGNKMLFTVNNTVNQSLGANSPISFKPGGFGFNHIVGNADFSKEITERFYVALGSEFRSENYQLIAGDTASYSGEGANSFPGFSSRNAIKANRSNIGFYADATWDITDKFLISGTARTERYSDFGNAFVWKASSRYKLFDDKLTIRGSYSTGFRAPTLHQINLQLNQASFEGGDIVIKGLANNLSREAAILGVPKLKAETSKNYTVGIGINPVSNFSMSVDYYDIDIRNRIVYSATISKGTNDALDALLASANSTGISFFVNGVHTRTKGIDIVASYRNLAITSGLKANINLAGNNTLQNKLIGDVNTPQPIAAAGGKIFTKTEEALMLTSRPKYKYILGLDLVTNKFSVNINNTLFGPTRFSNADLFDKDALRVQFTPNVLTDIGVTYAFTDKISLSITAQNIFDVYPKWKLVALNSNGQATLNDADALRLQKNALTFNGRYGITTYDGSQFNQLGTNFTSQLLFKL
ncbi:TonB-dependent receptor [Ohtaekwangia sp.]|uniref:TonB-dependent receptor n=1 Tax=Ohtaekwangia sp. TaxID=2066019 RepID=UPI002F9591A3